MFKYDFSRRDADGERLPAERETMAQDSDIYAPELFNVPELKKLMEKELKTDAGESVHVAHDDGRGAEVRDVE
eukprot:7008082-Prymnesium_polylepis.1